MSVSEAEVEIATRIFCHGIPMDIDPRSMTLAGLIAKGRCMAPDCKCWEPGKEVARAALEAAETAKESEVMQHQPNRSADNAPPGSHGGRALTARDDIVAERDCLCSRLERCEAALREIMEGKGRFSLDHFEHAKNTIEDMKEIARAYFREQEQP